MLDVESAFHFFVARLDGLAFVVMVKPDGQGRENAIISIVNESGILDSWPTLKRSRATVKGNGQPCK